MVINTLQNSPQVIEINGKPHLLNLKEYETFLQQCELFMSVEDNGLETMVQIVSDQLLDGANPNTTIEEIRPQLKFMREVGFLLKNLITPFTGDRKED